MANQLKMAEVHSILTLRTRGWSFRRIARELGYAHVTNCPGRVCVCSAVMSSLVRSPHGHLATKGSLGSGH